MKKAEQLRRLDLWTKIAWVCADIEKLLPTWHRRAYGPGFTESMFRVLVVLAEEGEGTIPKIARLARLTRQSTQRACKELEQRGDIEMVNNPDHKRAKLIKITEQGQSTRNGRRELFLSEMKSPLLNDIKDLEITLETLEVGYRRLVMMEEADE
jgi:DNA-binding MarR family transcriptional regulator